MKKTWMEHIEVLRPHVAKISSPRGHGTGFLFSYAAHGSLCAVATAAHVVNDAADWEEPLRIEQKSGGRHVFLRPGERAILRRPAHDTAAIVFGTQKDLFPTKPLALIPDANAARAGAEIGWVGFPGVAPDQLCFFLGRISSVIKDSRSYLVDGVAINGVSGGPAFGEWEDGEPIVIGILSAYLPNVQAAGTLPGLCMVRHVGGLHDIVKEMTSLEEAKTQADQLKTDTTSAKDLAEPPAAPPAKGPIEDPQ